MVYTITFNPALDYISQVDNFEIGKINRTKTEKILPGGKGLNVSMVLKNLGIESTAIGFIAGFTGDELQREIKSRGIKTEFIKVNNGITRINVKISSNVETALNGNGPQITAEDIDKLLSKVKQINKNDIVVLAGNIPKSIKKDIYEIICSELKKREIQFIVDATRELLVSALKFNPFLVKPNREELAETFNTKIKTKEDIIIYAKKLQEMGAKNVLVSLGGDGAILVTMEGKEYYSKAPKGKVLNTVGSGDSMVAGFIAGLKKSNENIENISKTTTYEKASSEEFVKNYDFEKAFKMGIAAGSASAFSMDLATEEEVNDVLKQL